MRLAFVIMLVVSVRASDHFTVSEASQITQKASADPPQPERNWQPMPSISVHSVMYGGPEQDCSIVIKGDFGLNISIPHWGMGYILLELDPKTWATPYFPSIRTYKTWPAEESELPRFLKDVQAMGNGTKAIVAACDASAGDGGGGIDPAFPAMKLLGSTQFDKQLAPGTQLRVAFALMGEKGGTVTKEVYDKSAYSTGDPSNVQLNIAKGAYACASDTTKCNICAACCKDIAQNKCGQCFQENCNNAH